MADGAFHGQDDGVPAGRACDAAGETSAHAALLTGNPDTVFPPLPEPGECHIWAVGTADLEPVLGYLRSLLDPAEQARAAGSRTRAAGARFVASRGAQRVLAGRYLGLEPASVTVDRRCRHCGDPDHGRPRIGGAEAGRAGLEYSVTHAGELLLLVYAGCGPVGIDAEPADRQMSAGRLARYALSPAEAAMVSAASGARQRAVFSRLWTRKEALLKLTGHGITAPLRSVDVTADTVAASFAGAPPGWPGTPVRLTGLDLGAVNPDPSRRYVAALATTFEPRRVTIRSAAPFLAAPAPPGPGGSAAPPRSPAPPAPR